MIPGLYQILEAIRDDIREQTSGYEISVLIGRVDKLWDEVATKYVVTVDWDADATKFQVDTTFATGTIGIAVEVLTPSEYYDSKCFDIGTIIFQAIQGGIIGGKMWVWDGQLQDISPEGEAYRAYRYIFLSLPQVIEASA